MDNNSVEALFTDCFKLPSTTFINTITHNSGIKSSKIEPIKIPAGSHKRDLPTPKVPTMRLVKKSWINNEITLKVENQKPKKEVNSSSVAINLEA